MSTKFLTVKYPLKKLAVFFGLAIWIPGFYNVTTVYIYFAADPECHRKQLLLRYAAATMSATADENEKSLRTATMLFFSQLDEQQRRLYAGLEALKLGHGGNQTVAEQFGLDAHTVAKGKQELLERTYLTARVRHAGGGRVALKKTARNIR